MSPIEILIHNEDRYVLAKELYSLLELSQANYSATIKSWFLKEYYFQDKKTLSIPVQNYDYVLVADSVSAGSSSTTKSIGQLLSNTDYSYRTMNNQASIAARGRPTDNYLIRLELAKLIALDSNSRFKKEFVHWLLSLEAKMERNQLLSRSTLLGLMEMVKLCSYIDNQLLYYKTHKDQYFELKEEDDGWWEFDRWRNSVLHLLNEADLTEKFVKIKGYKPGKSMTKIEKMAILDALESIRTSLFDFLAVQLQQIKQARDLSDFVKELFEKAGITQFDMKPKGYSPNGQLDMFRGIQDIDIKLVSQTLKELKPVI